jgi:hypothetical protein
MNVKDSIPNVEELYDMDHESLICLKENIEKNNDKSDNKIMKIYKHVIFEIKERENMNNIFDFFINQNIYDEFTASIREDKYIENKPNINNSENVKKSNSNKIIRNAKVKGKIKKLNPVKKKNQDIKSLNIKCFNNKQFKSFSIEIDCKTNQSGQSIVDDKFLLSDLNLKNNFEISLNTNQIYNNENIISVLQLDKIVDIKDNNINNFDKSSSITTSFDKEDITDNNEDSIKEILNNNINEYISNKEEESKDSNIPNNNNIEINKKLKIVKLKKKRLLPIDKNKLSKIIDNIIETPLKVEPINYRKIYTNINQLFNGPYYNRKFNISDILDKLISSLQNMINYNKETDYDIMNLNIVNNETEIIKDRLRKVSDKLLYDQGDFNEDNFFIFKKMLELEKKNYARREKSSINTSLFYRVILNTPNRFDIFCYTLGLRENWRELPHGLNLGQTWNILWTYSFPTIDFNNLFVWQRVNHFINNKTLSRKDLLKKAISKIATRSKKLKSYYHIMPLTFILSREYIEFVDEFKRCNKDKKDNKWIVKPIGKSRGNGIFLANDISEVPNIDSHLVQKYITNPLLLDGYKFDMRIYVLVTSFNPLEAFIYKDGFARMSNYLFSLAGEEREIHLTNAAIQNKIALNSNEHTKVFGGSKISLEMLKNKLSKMNIEFNSIWEQIKDIVLKSLIACEIDIPNSPSSFELLGYDIIIDTNSKCWLLEINTSPSLERNCVLDDHIKLQLLDNIVDIINPIDFDKPALLDFLNKLKKNYNIDEEFNIDMMKILKGQIPRKIGEIPYNIKNFEMIAPSKQYEKIIKLINM